MLLTNCRGVIRRGGVSALSVRALPHVGERRFFRQAFLSILLHAHLVRWFSTSHVRCSESAKRTERDRRQMREPHLCRLAVVRPDLVDEWVPELNDADVSCVQCTSQLTMWWRCAACGENFEATVKDRAISDKGCPRCSPLSAQQQKDPQQATVRNEKEIAKEGVKPPSLAETHPAFLSRWDYEKNGLLRPTDVTFTSELSVWWKPANKRPGGEQSFRRSVIGFVEMPYSVEEQLEAQKALELETLSQVRRAAKISEARELGTLPEDVLILDNVFLNSHCDSDKESDESGSLSSTAYSKDTFEFSGEDLQLAVEAWERNFDLNSDSAHCPVFYHTQTFELVEVSREEIFNAYNQFVISHKGQRAANEGVHGDNDVCDRVIPSAITDHDWVQHFTLSVDDISKEGFPSSARLIFSDAAEHAKQVPLDDKNAEKKKMESSERQRTEASLCRADTLPRPPAEYENEVQTLFAPQKKKSLYPRLPPAPPRREDDVAEAVPKEEKTRHWDLSRLRYMTDIEKQSCQSKGVPAEAAFEVVSLASSQSLAREYTSSSDTDVLFDASEEEVRKNTLLGQAALQSMSTEEARALQYNRGTPRPRRTGRFRLRPPTDDSVVVNQGALTAMLSSASVAASRKNHEGHDEAQQIIQAPGTPRKVARPKKKSKETVG